MKERYTVSHDTAQAFSCGPDLLGLCFCSPLYVQEITYRLSQWTLSIDLPPALHVGMTAYHDTRDTCSIISRDAKLLEGPGSGWDTDPTVSSDPYDLLPRTKDRGQDRSMGGKKLYHSGPNRTVDSMFDYLWIQQFQGYLPNPPGTSLLALKSEDSPFPSLG